jgi:hypothetical protein
MGSRSATYIKDAGNLPETSWARFIINTRRAMISGSEDEFLDYTGPSISIGSNPTGLGLKD